MLLKTTSECTVAVDANSFTDSEMVHSLCHFLTMSKITPSGANLYWKDGIALDEPRLRYFTNVKEAMTIDLTVEALNDSQEYNYALISKTAAPMLLLGHKGIPQKLTHVCIPFEGGGGRFRLRWIYELLTVAASFGWKVRLVHCDHGFVAHEIMRFADWFRMDPVKQALKEWLSDDVRRKFRDFMEDFPETDVVTDVGRLGKIMVQEDPQSTILLGHLKSGYHLPHRHHGLNYGRLLTQTGMSAVFVEGSKRLPRLPFLKKKKK